MSVFSHAVSTNNYGPYKWIVSDTADGTHTTLAGALASASSGDTIFLRKSVTENVTLKDGVNIVGPTPCYTDSTANIKITGKLIDNGTAAKCSLKNLSFETNSDYILVLSNAGSAISFEYCNLKGSNNTLLSLTAAATVVFEQCSMDLATTAITLFSTSSAVTVKCSKCYMTNSGGSTSNIDQGAGTLELFDTYCEMQIYCTSSGNLGVYNCVLDSTGKATYCFGTGGSGTITCTNSTLIGDSTFQVNVQSSSVTKLLNCSLIGNSNTYNVLTAGTAVLNAYNCSFTSGSNYAINLGSGTTANLSKCIINSSSTSQITGLGTANISGLSFAGSSKAFDVTNKTYPQSGTWTPALKFGGNSVGMTYSNQGGFYTRIDDIVFYSLQFILSAKGSSTGAATIEGLPFTSAAFRSYGSFYYGTLTYPAGYTDLHAYVALSSTNLGMNASRSANTSTGLGAAHFANTTQIVISGFYHTS